ncbi:Na(+)/H(+) antiporter subunit F1 [Salipaludibacillus sp. CF4.18]|uniref:Na(+)/H(+) antiporter subunit F1 n=1 Tax=Salipaludibacillus sp. CF4.18 TaxID=3373081 RepID=UPI003EE49E1C
MLYTFSHITLVLMSLSIAICLYRVFIGPTIADRIVALDTTGINLIGFIGIIMILQDTVAYSEAILVIAILAFIGTIAFSKFLEGGVVIDRNHH